ncbi:MAG: GatB/YqeY domain-containing protein [Anaerolineales bacterium]|nr:GatB/YqeY domain-containing protein [Anaerolineales bacterium]
MSLKEQLQDALKDAMRANDDLRKRTLRMAISAIRLVEVDRGAELDDNAVIAILQKEVKSRQEAIEEAHQAGRPELADAAQEEIGVLKGFLPEQLSPEELEQLARQVIEELGITDMRAMGQVMKVLVPRLEGRATGQQANQVVRKLLS